MTGDPSIGLEQQVTLFLIGRDGDSDTMKVAIEAGIGRDQRALKGSKSIEDVFALWRGVINLGETLNIERVGAQLRQQLLPRCIHQRLIKQYSFIVRFERAKITSPVQPEIQCGIEERRGVEIDGEAVD